ncbi:hypothetical protein AVEN_206297-1 [Araneus ventricosus]|uniref:Uncharacterized protein n=1 Tax=Araneus ventricosus TaxID=182803 RepID=A0A4Y2A6H0_ARAVE|nr:hypothetical protein AVEN_262764-1 [Araneus ventricosus]GBL74529.1 hypothetical protein AVEN_268437-1 [Araneus ventricosus]GBL74539.1 hypothetical protein AVEN_127324-1 [Araneus ventricosus]GBL74578.1 hypothetical protein AVEN_206297-1 [Araneus ventricosus]
MEVAWPITAGLGVRGLMRTEMGCGGQGYLDPLLRLTPKRSQNLISLKRKQPPETGLRSCEVGISRPPWTASLGVRGLKHFRYTDHSDVVISLALTQSYHYQRRSLYHNNISI